MAYFPMFVELKDQDCLVAGGGKVAERKVRILLEYGPKIRVVAPEATEEIKGLAKEGKIRLDLREFCREDLDGAGMVIAASCDKNVNREISACCKSRRIPVNVVDVKEECSFFFPALVKDGPVTVGISTGGESPAMAGLLKKRIRQVIPEGCGQAAAWVGEQRERLKAEISDGKEREELFKELAKRALGQADEGKTGESPAGRSQPGQEQADAPSSHPGTVSLIGAGPGDPGLITVKGRERLKTCQAVVYDHLASPEFLEETPKDCQRIYVGKQAGRHSMTQEEINGLLVKLAKQGLQVARLKGGDPFVFGRGGEEILALKEAGISWEVIPGVTSAVAAPECAGIPVTHRAVSRSFHVITAHGKDEEELPDFSTLAPLTGTLVFLMGLGRLSVLAKGLIQAGKRADCPAAVIEKGSLPGQRTVRGTLEDIAGKVQTAGLRTPAVIVVGETAAMDLSCDGEAGAMDLSCDGGGADMKTSCQEEAAGEITKEPSGVVGLTGTDGFCRKLEESFSGLGIKTRRIGGLEICSAEKERWEALFDSLREHQILAFTSANGVRLFFKELFARKMDARNISHMKIAAVGEGTARELEGFGLLADWTPQRYTTEDLANLLVQNCKPGQRVLIPRSADGSKELNRILDKAGISYSDVPIYTAKGRAFSKELLEGLSYLVFGSASGAEAFLEGLTGCQKGPQGNPEKQSPFEPGGELWGLPLGAVGPYAAQALKLHGAKSVLYPKRYTADCLARAVAADMKK